MGLLSIFHEVARRGALIDSLPRAANAFLYSVQESMKQRSRAQSIIGSARFIILDNGLDRYKIIGV